MALRALASPTLRELSRFWITGGVSAHEVVQSRSDSFDFVISLQQLLQKTCTESGQGHVVSGSFTSA